MGLPEDDRPRGLVRLRILGSQPAPYYFDGGAGLRQRDAWLQPGQRADVAVGSVRPGVPSGQGVRHHGQRHEDVHVDERIGAAKARRGDAHDREWATVEANGFAHHVRIPVEAPLPVPVAQHQDGIGVRDATFAGLDQPADGGSEPEHAEVVSRHIRQPGALGPVVGRQASEVHRVPGHVLERIGLGAVVLHVEARQTAGRVAATTVGAKYYEAIGIANRQRPEEHAVDDAEDRGVRSDSQAECCHHGRGESRVAAQAANGVLHVLPDRVGPKRPGPRHGVSPPRSPAGGISNAARRRGRATGRTHSRSLGGVRAERTCEQRRPAIAQPGAAGPDWPGGAQRNADWLSEISGPGAWLGAVERSRARRPSNGRLIERPYSSRSATTGSTRIAWRTGRHAAAAAARTSVATMTP